MGRLVGYVELQKGPANKTDLDVPPAFRNDVLRSKKVLIGCGGGYHQECSQPYSPVAKWIEEVDVALNDEGQQYGNLDEASAIARTPRKCIIIWCGDHKQTTEKLRKTDEAKKVSHKMPFLALQPLKLGGGTCVLRGKRHICKRVKATVMFSRGRRNAFVLVRYTISWQARRFGTWRSGCFESQCQGCANKTQVVKSRGRDSILSPKSYFLELCV